MTFIGKCIWRAGHQLLSSGGEACGSHVSEGSMNTSNRRYLTEKTSDKVGSGIQKWMMKD